MTSFEERLDPGLREVLASLRQPTDIQDFLDQTSYSTEYANRSPVRVLRDRIAHCLDGGLFAAAVLRRLGHPPLVVDLLPEPGTDDDHVLAIFRCDGGIGAVAKSNFTGLRYREPIYRNIRELALSYFESFFNVHGRRTLRAYTVPLNLERFDGLGWMWNDAAADVIEQTFPRLQRRELLTPEMAAALAPVDKLSYQAGTLGTSPAGLYKPKT